MALTFRRQFQIVLTVIPAVSFVGLAYHQYGWLGLSLALASVVMFFLLMLITVAQDQAVVATGQTYGLPRSWRFWTVVQLAYAGSIVILHGLLLYAELQWLGLGILALLILLFDVVIRRDQSLRTS